MNSLAIEVIRLLLRLVHVWQKFPVAIQRGNRFCSFVLVCLGWGGGGGGGGGGSFLSSCKVDRMLTMCV